MRSLELIEAVYSCTFGLHAELQPKQFALQIRCHLRIRRVTMGISTHRSAFTQQHGMVGM